MKRQSLDDLAPGTGQRVRVYFPHGGRVRVMRVTGTRRPGVSGRCDYDHLLCSDSNEEEWVPGWYLSVPLGSTGQV